MSRASASRSTGVGGRSFRAGRRRGDADCPEPGRELGRFLGRGVQQLVRQLQGRVRRVLGRRLEPPRRPARCLHRPILREGPWRAMRSAPTLSSGRWHGTGWRGRWRCSSPAPCSPAAGRRPRPPRRRRRPSPPPCRRAPRRRHPPRPPTPSPTPIPTPVPTPPPLVLHHCPGRAATALGGVGELHVDQLERLRRRQRQVRQVTCVEGAWIEPVVTCPKIGTTRRGHLGRPRRVIERPPRQCHHRARAGRHAGRLPRRGAVARSLVGDRPQPRTMRSTSATSSCPPPAITCGPRSPTARTASR